ncbi:fimbrial protein, partial [Salmonella enterica subsp. enterica serovar Montevideo]|nr:fimbrial protein [Salmonella enterica subsp. enterica serovar Montevideo]
LLGNYIKVKPLDCHGAVICAHDNTNHEYSFKVPIKIFFTKTTCSLSNNEITLPPISLSDLLAGNAQVEYFPDALKFTCDGGLGMTTSIVNYHFSAVSATNGDYLANELTSADSAKNVGFKIFLNDSLIHVNSDEKRQLLGYNKEMTEASELKLGVQYYKYGNVQPGNVKSSVYIITSYQ